MSVNNPPAESANPDEQREPEQSQPVDVRDLVYSGGFDGDPQEILSNPAVAPQTLSDGRDQRPDLFRESEAATPEPIDQEDASDKAAS